MYIWGKIEASPYSFYTVYAHFLTPSFDDLGPGRAGKVCFHSKGKNDRLDPIGDFSQNSCSFSFYFLGDTRGSMYT